MKISEPAERQKPTDRTDFLLCPDKD